MQLTDQNKTGLTIGLIIAALAAIAVIYFDFATVRPQLRTNETAHTTATRQIGERETRLKEINTFLADTELRERLIRQVEAAQRRLPTDQQAEEFLDILRIAMRDTGVAFSRIAPPTSPEAV